MPCHPAVRIKRECAKKAMCKMKSSLTSGPSGIVVERLKVYGEAGIDLVSELADSLRGCGSW